MSASPEAISPPPAAPRAYKHLDFITVAFVTLLLCSNLIGTTKVATLGGYTFGAAILFFPLSYVFGDILTEVYGYAASRRVVWSGFGALFFSALMCWVIVELPPAPDFKGQEAVQSVFGNTPRVVMASLIAYSFGEFTNSFVLAKMKLMTQGKLLWLRTIGSTLVGEAVDSVIFYPLAFLGVWEASLVFEVMLTNYVLKCAWEAVMTPITYRVVAWLKRSEHEDYYDWKTNFSPFTLHN